MTLSRGIRNNNAGNIRWGSNWQGLVPQEKRTDKDFCQFIQPVYGLRAIVKLIFTYRDKYGLNTIESIINRYAPINENNTKGYIQRVCDKLGVGPNEPIELTDKVLALLIRAICGVENNKDGIDYSNYYSSELINRAIAMARG